MTSYRSFAGGLGNNLFQFAYIYAQARKKEIPDIYLQDPKHFEGFEEELRALYSQGVEPIEMVGVHVRRGLNPTVPHEPAYAENPFYVNLCETNYYERAMAEFPKDTQFLIVTDDKEFCKTTFPEHQIFEGETDVDDWNALAGCTQGVITANSSFSWWAAFANPSPIDFATSKQVIPLAKCFFEPSGKVRVI